MPRSIPLTKPFLRTLLETVRNEKGVTGEDRPGRILVVEDDYIVGLDLENRLLEAGHEVIGVADSAKHALRLAASGKPDLAIVDIRLAGDRDGVEVAVTLSDKLGVPSIFATAHGDSETKKRAAPARALGWLQKPYSSGALLALVEEALERYR